MQDRLTTQTTSTIAIPPPLCPECQQPMALNRILTPVAERPQLGAYYCKPCHFAETVALG